HMFGNFGKEAIDYFNHKAHSSYLSGTIRRWAYHKNPQVRHPNSFTNDLRYLGILNNKRVPQQYLKNDRNTRLHLLAGIIDSDGHVYNKCIELMVKNDELAQDIAFLSRSLGLVCNVKKRIKKCGDFS